MCSALPYDFYANELRQTLQEQSYGIHSFSIIATDPSQAKASVKLLEGSDIILRLTARGYTIDSDKLVYKKAEVQESVFESVEGLLQSASRLYESKRHEAWVKELEKLKSNNWRRRSWSSEGSSQD